MTWRCKTCGKKLQKAPGLKEAYTHRWVHLKVAPHPQTGRLQAVGCGPVEPVDIADVIPESGS